MSGKRIKLFLSFSWLFNKLSRNIDLLSKEDLENSLFSFGCSRDGAMDKDFVMSNLWHRNIDAANAAFNKLIPILKDLESKGKVQFRKNPVTYTSYTINQYNEFLIANELNPIVVDQYADPENFHFANLHFLKENTELANPNVDAFFQG